MPASDNTKASKEDYENWVHLILKNNFGDWREYKSQRYKIKLSKKHFLGSNFTSLCQNMVYMIVIVQWESIQDRVNIRFYSFYSNDKIVSYPAATVSKPLESRRKRGRPRKATNAFVKINFSKPYIFISFFSYFQINLRKVIKKYFLKLQ